MQYKKNKKEHKLPNKISYHNCYKAKLTVTKIIQTNSQIPQNGGKEKLIRFL
jgi:hypothetical protein